jgi:UDP-glucose:(heptosyl)LPS alpha-1,3-glucosyltransferase
MKIALVVHDLHDHGGHSRYTRTLAEGFAGRHQVTVFANRCERPAQAAWQFQQVRAWRSSALATVQTFPLGLRTHAATLAGYDIRHAQGFCGGKPNVVTAHICAAAYLDSLSEISARNRASLKLMAAAEERFYRRYQGTVIAVSAKVALELRELYGVAGPIKVVPHGVDHERFNRGKRARHRAAVRRELGVEHQTLALYVGDLTKSHTYLKALAAAAPQVRFVLVTPSRRYHWTSPNVQILPPTVALERYYAAADAFVFPTAYDSFGMVVLEAMAAGLPVFSSDQAGAAELITSGADGYVMPLSGWVAQTAARLQQRPEFERVGLAASLTARRHGWPQVVAKVEQVYEEVLRTEDRV